MGYLPSTAPERGRMLRALGLDDPEALFREIPAALRLGRPLALEPALSELELERELTDLARRNLSLDEVVSFLGAGAYDRFVPAIVDEVVRRSEFYTAYTPYQPEVSQGTLTAIYEFQSYVCALTGLDVANASMYDGASALAEAGVLACHATGRDRLVVSRAVDPVFRQVLGTYARGQGIRVSEAPLSGYRTDADATAQLTAGDVAGVIVAQPNFFGAIEDPEPFARRAHEVGALLIAVADPVGLAVLKPPGRFGADVAVGEAQSWGLPPSFGGPFLGYFAARRDLLRRLPGRIAGGTVDREGRVGYVLTFQTREQHIRRERATSNVCTNQALCALAATVYLAALGPGGLRDVAALSAAGARRARSRLAAVRGYEPMTEPFFQEFVTRSPVDPEELGPKLLERGILMGLPLAVHYPEFADRILWAVTERRTERDIDALGRALEEIA